MTTRFTGGRTDEHALEVVALSGATKPALAVSGDVQATGGLGIGGKTPAAQQANIADASTAHALNVVFSDTEVETALNNLGTKINSIIAVLEAYGLTAS